MPSTITPSKTSLQTILSHQEVTHPATVVGSWINCATKRAAAIYLYHGYIEATADTNPGKFLIQTRPDSAGGTETEHAATILELTAKGTTPDSKALTATEPSGETTIAVASTTGFAIGDVLYIRDASVSADSEWAICKTLVTNTNIQLIDGLTVGKDSADTIYNDGTVWGPIYLDLTAVTSFRVVWTHEGATGANDAVKVLAEYYDSDSAS